MIVPDVVGAVNVTVHWLALGPVGASTHETALNAPPDPLDFHVTLPRGTKLLPDVVSVTVTLRVTIAPGAIVVALATSFVVVGRAVAVSALFCAEGLCSASPW